MKIKTSLSANGLTIPVNFAVVAHVRGPFLLASFSAALAKTQQRHPLIAAHVYTDDEGNWYGTDGGGEFSIRVTDGEWTAAIEAELNVPFSLDIGPLVRFVLVKNGDMTDVVMVCHHAIADGLSAVYVLRDLLSYIGDPDASVEPAPASPPMDDLLPPFDPSILADFQPSPNPKNRVLGDPSIDSSRLYVLAHALTESQTAALGQRARQEQTSVHGALCAAFLTAHMQIESGEPDPIRKVSSPVNLRGHFTPPVGEQFGGYINPSVHTVLNCNDGRSFWELAWEVKESLRRDTDGMNAFKALLVFRYMLQKARTEKDLDFFKPGHFADYDLSITNLGRLDFPTEYGPLCLEAISGPSVNPLGQEKVLGVATAPYWLMDRPMAQQLLSTAEQLLAEAVGW